MPTITTFDGEEIREDTKIKTKAEIILNPQ